MSGDGACSPRRRLFTAIEGMLTTIDRSEDKSILTNAHRIGLRGASDERCLSSIEEP